MFNTIWYWLTEPPVSVPEPERRRMRLLASLLVVLTPVAFVLSVASRVANPESVWRNPGFWIGLIAFLAWVVAYGLNRSGRYTLAAAIVIGSTVVGVFGVAAPYDTVGKQDFLVFLIVSVLFGSLLLPTRATIVLVAINVVLMLTVPTLWAQAALIDIALGPLSFILLVSPLILLTVHYHSQVERDRQAALAEEANVNASMADLSRALLSLSSIEAVSERVLERAKHLTRSSLGYVGYIDAQTGYLVCPDPAQDFWVAGREQVADTVLQELGGLWGSVLTDRKSLLVNQLEAGVRLCEIPIDVASIRRTLSVPVTMNDGLIGQVTVAGAERDYVERDLVLLNRLADLYAIAIQRQRLEEQLLQAQKMEAVGRLAGGVAHDFNNHLTTISGYASLLLSALDTSDPMRADVREIQKAARRSAALTRQLLAFSRKQVIQPRTLNLNLVIADMAKMLRRLIGEDIALILKLAPSVNTVRADPAQVEQIVMNLTVNARDAMPNGGHLTIETSNVELDTALTHHQVVLQPGSYVVLAVSDDGTGMDSETQSRIFEPFFTTKERGKGTGLGLATVYGIVRQSSGHIRVSSEPGRGTTFQVTLPAVAEPAEPVHEGQAVFPTSRGSETILLAEDDDSVRVLARRTLERSGYTVLEASDAGEALALSERHPDVIHLLITDVIMPEGMNGREVAERLVALRSRMRVLYISGYTDDAIAHHGVLDPGVSLLSKPFAPEALARQVREILDE